MLSSLSLRARERERERERDRGMASGLRMDQETAQELVKKGATLLLLDVPQFTLFGIDTQMFSVGPNFKGIKMIPPGPHFVCYSSANKEGNEFSPTIGFFITTSYSEVVVRRWHCQDERLVKISEDEECRYSKAVKHLEFDNQLGPYALDHFVEWKRLSGYITNTAIERLEPIGGDITIACESGLIQDVPRTAMEKQLIEQLNISKFSRTTPEDSPRQKCYYTKIPQIVKRKDISGEELTAMNLDKTQLLETILLKDFKGAENLLLAELQFAFVAFMMGQSLQAFLQWKTLVSLFLCCTEAPLRTRSQLFSKFIEVIYWQLKHGFQKQKSTTAAEGKGISVFLDDAWFSKDIFLYRLCKTRKLKGLLEDIFGWDFEESALDVMCEDGDEYAPVVVPPDEAMPVEDQAN
ncbi:A1 cistron-splicing factor AAR2 protein [Dioscorea alata]|uniref:A1 cistron-splicing factor AAR2 protein n=1 Tax=Dioscorea alata TaxID=55571 RepID=A0ACB7UDV8_DIOAL|nr:A1 cistron-splicing factor AAR2 protein [Dioscorea alata]